jgi:hypothetical protein
MRCTHRGTDLLLDNGNLVAKDPAMKALAFLVAAAALALPVRAQTPGGSYNPDQLDQLVAPIALYPDPLVALILPASTFPSDITLADRYVEAQMDLSTLAAQPWDPSVRALAHYPDLLRWMDYNLAWTQALGHAVFAQQADVMGAIQSMRARALATGALVSTPQQRVETVGGIIRIVPVEGTAIYLPRYDPGLAYDARPGFQGPVITFGIAFPVGDWLAFECDWDDFAIWSGPWHGGWDYRREWRSPDRGIYWRAGPRQEHGVSRDPYRLPDGVPHPRPIGGRGNGAPSHGSGEHGRGGAAPGQRSPAAAAPGKDSRMPPGEGDRRDRH